MRYYMTEDALNRIGKMWVDVMKRKILEKNKFASGFLYNSINYKVIVGSDGNPTLEVEYADYWKYVNKGRTARGTDRPISATNKSDGKPGAVPIPALLKWISIKGITGKDKKGKELTPLSLAFAIRASIWKFGIQPARLFDDTIVELEDMLNPLDIPEGTPPELRRELENIFISAREDINVIIENMIDKQVRTT